MINISKTSLNFLETLPHKAKFGSTFVKFILSFSMKTQSTNRFFILVHIKQNVITFQAPGGDSCLKVYLTFLLRASLLYNYTTFWVRTQSAEVSGPTAVARPSRTLQPSFEVTITQLDITDAGHLWLGKA